MVSRCKARKRYMKQLVKARQAFSAAHIMYLRSLRNTGSALLQFATAETNLLHHHHLPPLNPTTPPPPFPTPPPPMSPISWTTTTSTTTSSAIRPPPPPPPPPVPSASTALLWNWGSSSARWNAFGKSCGDPIGNNVGGLAADGNATHCSTVERLYAWEKKLYQEVKNAEQLKLEHEKKAAILRKLEMKNADYIKTEKAKKEVEKLESQMMVALQAIETTSTEIIKLRESELYPQLFQLVMGLMSMWRSMYEFHQVQTHIVQQLKYLNFIPSIEPTSEIHRQSTLQLELEAQQWHLSFCNLMKAQRDYIQSLTGWLRLSLFQVGNNPINKTTKQDSTIYPFCEEWQLAINNAPDKVASEGIKSFLTVIHAIVVQQAEEQKQKRRSDSVFKELEKKAGELRSLENKHGPYSILETSGDSNKDPVREKRAKVEILRAKAADEKSKYEKSIGVTRAMTMNNLQMGR
ncbi:hypothetical protein DH2020_048228 [Rehmannia glutinosa]|uniref:Uncharacterized protein n=1 Tax=Rehmannia glutinosa TaxID=99300 RepID=A0ABR0U676_REHGL